MNPTDMFYLFMKNFFDQSSDYIMERNQKYSKDERVYIITVLYATFYH